MHFLDPIARWGQNIQEGWLKFTITLKKAVLKYFLRDLYLIQQSVV